uniref:(northern house mosquito) hypothetical protein n=1 Tax=Culex pipiens TaxID=7175 RepID=A0A8D8L6M5_CULPI
MSTDKIVETVMCTFGLLVALESACRTLSATLTRMASIFLKYCCLCKCISVSLISFFLASSTSIKRNNFFKHSSNAEKAAFLSIDESKQSLRSVHISLRRSSIKSCTFAVLETRSNPRISGTANFLTYFMSGLEVAG